MALSVRYQNVAGEWVTLGTQIDNGRGVLPESIKIEGDRGEYGILGFSFRLKQDPRWISNELQAFTPIQVWDGAECIAPGRVIATPLTFGEDDMDVVVECEGMGQHLKDDATPREWVIDDMGRFEDTRSRLDEDLSLTPTGAVVTNEGRGILLSFPKGMAVTAAAPNRFGVALDLGPNVTASRAVVELESSNNSGAFNLSVAIGPVGSTGAAYLAGNYAVRVNNAGTAPLTVTATTPNRFVIITHHNAGANTTLGVDVWFRIKSVKIFTDAADESGGQSVLKASTAIGEVLDECAPLISPDRSLIQPTDFNLPQFPGEPGWHFAHELITRADAPHGWIKRLTTEPIPRFEYKPVPTDWAFVVGEGEYQLLEPAANVGRQVASRTISEYETASGERAYAIAGAPAISRSLIQLANPSFVTDTAGWSTWYGTLSRDTSIYYTSPASLKCVAESGTGISGVRSGVTGLTPGDNYRFSFMLRAAVAGVTGAFVIVHLDDGTTPLPGYEPAKLTTKAIPVGEWIEVSADFVAPANGIAYIGIQNIVVGIGGTPHLANVDDVTLYSGEQNMIVKRGFRRTMLAPFNHRTVHEAAQRVAQLELDNRQHPDFKGTLTITGMIRTKSGALMHASRLPSMVGENILIKNLYDSNTQGLGRRGNIASVIYDDDKKEATIGLDRDLRFIRGIDALRTRLEFASR